MRRITSGEFFNILALHYIVLLYFSLVAPTTFSLHRPQVAGRMLMACRPPYTCNVNGVPTVLFYIVLNNFTQYTMLPWYASGSQVSRADTEDLGP